MPPFLARLLTVSFPTDTTAAYLCSLYAKNCLRTRERLDYLPAKTFTIVMPRIPLGSCIHVRIAQMRLTRVITNSILFHVNFDLRFYYGFNILLDENYSGFVGST